MTATVTHLASRRPRPRTRETCEGCRRAGPGRECYPHRLDSLAIRLRHVLAANETEILVSVDVLNHVITDALGVLDSITSECGLPDERSAR